MSKIALIFSRSASLHSALIRVATWSPWSHVGLVVGDSVIDAAPGEGVRLISMAQLERESDHCKLVELPCRRPDVMALAASQQIGKPYDWSAIFGLTLHRDWSEPDKWFCAELVAWAFAEAGEPLFRHDVISRVTPQHLWMLAPVQAD